MSQRTDANLSLLRRLSTVFSIISLIIVGETGAGDGMGIEKVGAGVKIKERNFRESYLYTYIVYLS